MLNLGVLGLSIFLLVRASYFVVQSLSAISRYLGVSEFILSFLLLSLATSLSELTVGVNAAISGIPELSLGDVLGTNLVNLTLVLGLIAIIGRSIKLRDYKQFASTRLANILLVSAPFVLLIDGRLSRFDGAILLLLFIAHIAQIARNKEEFTTKKTFKETMQRYVQYTALTRKEFLTRISIFLVSSLVLIGSAYMIVYAATNISEAIGVSEFVIGLFVIAVGTSLPELTVGLRAVRNNKSAISIGNLFGAVTINATLVLGVVALINPIHISDPLQYVITFTMTIGTILLVYFFMRNNHIINARNGAVLLAVYSLFLLLQSTHF